MGLDGVGLILETEDRFRVSLPDEECARVRTVGDLAALVASQLARVVGVCPTARAFFSLRRDVASVTGGDRRTLRPSTPLAVAIPRERRRRSWERLRRLNRRVPELEPPPWGRTLLRAAGWTLFAGWSAATVASISPLGAHCVWVALLGGLLSCVLWGSITCLLSTEFPDGCADLGDLARRITPVPLPPDTPEARQQILQGVRVLTSMQLGVPLDKVKPESRFVDDLGMA